MVKKPYTSGTLPKRINDVEKYIGVEYQKSKSDKLVRSLIRHDPKKLARAIIELIDR